MNPQQGCKFILEKYLYGAVCQDRLDSDDLVLIRNSIIEIKSGVTNSEGRGLNPNLFDVPPEVAAIVEKKDGVILDLKKEIENLNKQIKILRTSLNT